MTARHDYSNFTDFVTISLIISTSLYDFLNSSRHKLKPSDYVRKKKLFFMNFQRSLNVIRDKFLFRRKASIVFIIIEIEWRNFIRI